MENKLSWPTTIKMNKQNEVINHTLIAVRLNQSEQNVILIANCMYTDGSMEGRRQSMPAGLFV